MKYAIVVPTYNPGAAWSDWVEAVVGQSVQPEVVIVIDSSSTDGQIGSCEPSAWHIVKIKSAEFDHGGTRNKGFEMAAQHQVDYVVSLTQDSILADQHAIERLLEPFADAQVAAVCGRQLPRADANVRSKFARLFNYLPVSFINLKENIPERGIKTAFMSNSFAAYRLFAFVEVGRFPEKIIFGEDMYLAAKFILAGWKTYYNGEASSVHSHNYSLFEDFRRYFDIGVFHRVTPFLREQFGTASGEGLKFSIKELGYVAKNRFWAIPMVFLEVFTKFVGYKAGYNYKSIPKSIRVKLSLNRKYWKNAR